MQSRKLTVAEVQAVYNHMIGDLKSLGGVEKVAAGESGRAWYELHLPRVCDGRA
jgi:hypothetical protein